MISLKRLFNYFFAAVVLTVFVVGGSMQFYFGISNTGLTYLLLLLMGGYCLLYFFMKQFVFFDAVIFLLLLYAIVIAISALVNHSDLFKYLIYHIFVLLPLISYLFIKINVREGYLNSVKISRWFLAIGLLQLPVMLFQKYGYDYLMLLNNSGQQIEPVDAMFGTFFVKADHALGFFLLLNIFNLIQHNKDRVITAYPLLSYVILSLTILFSESSISKLVLLVLLLYFIYIRIPRKIRIFSVVILLGLSPLFLKVAKKIDAVEKEIYFMETRYTPDIAQAAFEKGVAKRSQVVITYLTRVSRKWIGDGPYSYFDILTGEFAKARHFSQLIWSYADLGLIGLVVVFLLLAQIVMKFGLDLYLSLLIYLIFIVFALMTTVFSDIAIMFSLFCVLKKFK